MARRLLPVFVAFLALTLFSPDVPPPVRAEPAGDVCAGDPVFPDDCVDQLGAIGEPPIALSAEGYRDISSPVVDPLLLLQSTNAANGRLFVLNPAGNRVRVLDPQNNLAVVGDVRVCYRPSALAQSADGSEVLVACHASNAIGVIDSATNMMVAEIQDRDAQGRPLLQEPMGMAMVGDTLYAASSQNNRIAVIDLPSREVQSYVDIPGLDPRALAVTADGKFLIVANFLAGNRTEVDMVLSPHLYDGTTGEVCAPLLQGAGANLIEESHPDFMDTSHPDYPTIAECYLFAHKTGTTSSIVINPARADHDLVVVRLSDLEVVFTTDSLPIDVGTLNYGVRLDDSSGRVYLASTHARNYLLHEFGNRPLLNQLAILALDSESGALSVQAVRDLDDPFLDDQGEGSSAAATPYGVAITGSRVLLAAAGSDRLVLTDLDGTVTGTVAVGFTPKGVVAAGDTAYVYNAAGLTVSKVDLVTGTEVTTASIGRNATPQIVRIGAHLMNSGQFAPNGTFSCASCHPDGHLDGLVWQLNAADGLRSTMTVQEISETGPYHWDGAKCNLAKILLDGISGLFQNPTPPTDCQMKTMIDFMNTLIRPHTPFRAADDSMTDEAKLGLAVFQRGRFKDTDDNKLSCTAREQDPVTEGKLLAAANDPYGQVLVYNASGGPIGGTGGNETCSVSGCHVTPHWASGGGLFEAVSVHGMWDRPVTMHHGRPMRAKFLEALEINRTFHGAPSMEAAGNVTGRVAAHAFNDIHFRHPEFNFDGNPATDAFALTDTMTQFMMEEEQLQTGAVGLTVVLDVDNKDDPTKNARLDLLQSAAVQGKASYLGVGLIAGLLRSMTWDPAAGKFNLDGGGSITLQQLKSALLPGDSVMLYGALLPNQGATPNPKLRAVSRTTSPILCSEGYADYHATLEVGEAGVQLLLHGIDVVSGSRVMIDGHVAGAPLAGLGPDFTWIMPQAPSEPTVLALQVLSPSGMQSNSVSLPVVSAVIAAFEPDDVQGTRPEPSTARLTWQDQFGITGPGTRYDVFRGELEELAGAGLTTGRCFRAALPVALVEDDEPLPLGRGFYYVVRAQNQVNVTTYGSPAEDADIAASTTPCPVLFP